MAKFVLGSCANKKIITQKNIDLYTYVSKILLYNKTAFVLGFYAQNRMSNDHTMIRYRRANAFLLSCFILICTFQYVLATPYSDVQKPNRHDTCVGDAAFWRKTCNATDQNIRSASQYYPNYSNEKAYAAAIKCPGWPDTTKSSVSDGTVCGRSWIQILNDEHVDVSGNQWLYIAKIWITCQLNIANDVPVKNPEFHNTIQKIWTLLAANCGKRNSEIVRGKDKQSSRC